MMLVSLISYIDRNTLALLAPTILRETGLTGEQYGYIISAFSIAYMIGNPVWGALLDRFGLRIGMPVAVGFWSVASAAHALAGGMLSFATARALLGFGEGATFPGGLRTAVLTLPPDKRARGTALAYSGGSLGAIVTPIVVTPIAVWGGWRAAFWFTGAIGILWLLLWIAVGPRAGRAHRTSGAVHPRLRDRNLWAFMSAYALGALPIAVVIYGAAIYLNRERGLSQLELGKLLWIPPLGWEAGYFFWGWFSDRGRGTFGLKLGMAAVLSLPLMLAPTAPNIPVLMCLLFLAMFVAAGFIILSVAHATSVFSGESAGLVAGLGAGSWSAVVAVVMPGFGRLFDTGRFDLAFTAAAVAPLIGFGMWVLLQNRGRSADTREDHGFGNF